MNKKYIVRLTKKEREELLNVVKRLEGSSQKVRRAQILLKADIRGPNWTDAKIAESFSCRVQTIEGLRQRLVTEGFKVALDGKQREDPPRKKCLDGKLEAKVISLRLGNLPKGFSNWTLRLLAEHVVDQPTAATPTTTESRCEPYPIENAEELTTNSDTGRRKIQGQIIATAAVRSKDTFTGGKGQQVLIYVIAINVDGHVVVVLLGSDSATGPGIYSSIDDFSERATSFPQNRRIGSSSTEGVAEARACVAKK